MATLQSTNITIFNLQEKKHRPISPNNSGLFDDLTLNGHYMSDETHQKSADLSHYHQKSMISGKRSSQKGLREKRGFSRGFFSFGMCCMEYSSTRKPYPKEINLKN